MSAGFICSHIKTSTARAVGIKRPSRSSLRTVSVSPCFEFLHIEKQGGVLVVGRDAGITYFLPPLFALDICNPPEPLFSASRQHCTTYSFRDVEESFRNASNVESQESCIHPMLSHAARARPVLRCSPLFSRHN